MLPLVAAWPYPRQHAHFTYVLCADAAMMPATACSHSTHDPEAATPTHQLAHHSLKALQQGDSSQVAQQQLLHVEGVASGCSAWRMFVIVAHQQMQLLGLCSWQLCQAAGQAHACQTEPAQKWPGAAAAAATTMVSTWWQHPHCITIYMKEAL